MPYWLVWYIGSFERFKEDDFDTVHVYGGSLMLKQSMFDYQGEAEESGVQYVRGKYDDTYARNA